MAIQWKQAQKIPPGMWAKAGKDNGGDWHILMGANEEHIRDSKSQGHDHYWKRDGQWYVQIRLSPGAKAVPSDNKGHLFGPNRLFSECPTSNLDKLLKQLS